MIVPRCEHKHSMHRIHSLSTGEPVMIGWYCPPCKKFYKAIGRERQLDMNYDKRKNHDKK